MRFARHLLCGTVLALGTVPALAGDKLLEGEAPAWVTPADLSKLDLKKGPATLIADTQYRMEGGMVVSYFDSASRIDNADALMEQNTVSLGWAPDKGDLTVHKLEIIRDGQSIDILGTGAKFEVIRREQGLENRLLDGELTATLSIPGLRVGDILRTAYSVTTRDQALGEEMQVLQYLGSAPWQVGFGRTVVSWPDGAPIRWKAEEQVSLAEPILRDGYRYLTVELPLPESKNVPGDAPSRYRRANVLRVGSFEDWNELSRVMAPHFVAASTVEDDSDVARQAADIMRQTSSPLERMQIATRLVQDKVSYLLNGMDGGNYLPQDADFTWDKRYGDCKAKTALLLALLTRMGIDAEPALVVSRGGDALPELLALPGDFDHVIVRAAVDGKDYWLDGTSIGTRMYNLGDVPNFSYALPLRNAGAGLIEMVQREKSFPDFRLTGMIDQSAGIDFPQMFDIVMEISGASGARGEALADANNPDMLKQVARSFATSSGVEGGILSSVAITYDKEKALARLRITGLGTSLFDYEDGKVVIRDAKSSTGFTFDADRSRREWRDIPVATQGPSYVHNEIKMALPRGGEGFSLSSSGSLEGAFANTRVSVQTTMTGEGLQTVQDIWQLPGEVPSSGIAAARREALRLTAASPDLVAPADITWRWDLDQKQRAAKAAPILAAYDKAIAFAKDDDTAPLARKAEFLSHIYLFKEALAEYDRLIDKAPEGSNYSARAGILLALGRRDDAIADLREAYDLEGSNGTAFTLAEQLAYAGKADEALALIEDLPVAEKEQSRFADVWSTVTGLKGDKDAAMAHLAEKLAARPENADLLNVECWFRGLFDVQVETALPGCTKAIERADNPAAALDSRALVEFRQGNYDAAIAGFDAVLKIAPAIANSRYMRGIARLRAGDKGGADDVATALVMDPNLVEFYGRHGIKPTV